MKTNNPYLVLLNQLADIMKVIENFKAKAIKIPQELIDELEVARKEFEKFKGTADQIMQAYDQDFNSLRIQTMRSPISETERSNFERAVHIERDAKILRNEMAKVKAKHHPTKKKHSIEEKENQKKIKERKKRFKSLDNNNKWIPL